MGHRRHYSLLVRALRSVIRIEVVIRSWCVSSCLIQRRARGRTNPVILPLMSLLPQIRGLLNSSFVMGSHSFRIRNIIGARSRSIVTGSEETALSLVSKDKCWRFMGGFLWMIRRWGWSLQIAHLKVDDSCFDCIFMFIWLHHSSCSN